jgi:hypothetical protein
MPFINDSSRQAFLRALTTFHIHFEDGMWGNFMGTVQSRAIIVEVETIREAQLRIITESCCLGMAARRPCKPVLS